jgi:DNA repair protein RadA/Sms
VPPGCGAGGADGVPAGMRVIEVADLRTALQSAAKAAADLGDAA